MTIIRPHSKKHLILVLVGVFLLLGAGGIFYISEYAKLANLRYQFGELKRQMAALQAEGADLSMAASVLQDPQQLQALAEKEGLIQERRPRYLKVPQWVSDSSL